MNHFLFLFFSIPLLVLFLTTTTQARLNTLTGGVTIGYDYDETKYERDDNIENVTPPPSSYLKQFSIGPLLIFETSSSIDNLTISFNPSYVYDLEESENEINHNFSLSSYRDFTRRLRIGLSDAFIYTDDPELLEAENSSDFNSGRRRYWTNDFNLNSTYTYGTNSSFGAGYSYRILRNDDTGPGGYEDYDRHIADLSLNHTINASWNFELTTSYTRGLFDPPDPEVVDSIEEGLEGIAPGITDDINTDDLSNDLSEYRVGAIVNWVMSTRKTFFVDYDFSASNYDAILRNDTNLHNLTFGARYQHTRRLSFGLGGGPSYEKTDTFAGNWDYNAFFDVAYNIAENSTITASVEKGYEQDNFSSNNNGLGRDQGLTEFWNWEVNLSHQITPHLLITLFGSYRDEKQQDILHGFVNSAEVDAGLESIDRETFREESIFSRDIYHAGGSLAYTFLKWYTASINYTYRTQDSEQIYDSYDEQRVYLTLSVQNELWRW